MIAVELRESGTLPIGAGVGGAVHRDFILRPRLVRDSIKVMEDPQAQTNDAYRGVALIACQIERLGDLPAEKIDTELLLGMLDADMSTLMEAASRLEGRLVSFRGESGGAAPGASGTGEDRGAVGASA